MTSLRREPEYGFIEDMVEVEGDEESLEDRFKSVLGSVTPELVQDGWRMEREIYLSVRVIYIAAICDRFSMSIASWELW